MKQRESVFFHGGPLLKSWNDDFFAVSGFAERVLDCLPNYDRLSHHVKIQLITSVRDSIANLDMRSANNSDGEEMVASKNHKCDIF